MQPSPDIRDNTPSSLSPSLTECHRIQDRCINSVLCRSEVQCSGNIPAARHSHSAAMLDSNLLLLWGGCGDKGAVYNDAHILNITTFR